MEYLILYFSIWKKRRKREGGEEKERILWKRYGLLVKMFWNLELSINFIFLKVLLGFKKNESFFRFLFFRFKI